MRAVMIESATLTDSSVYNDRSSRAAVARARDASLPIRLGPYHAHVPVDASTIAMDFAADGSVTDSSLA